MFSITSDNMPPCEVFEETPFSHKILITLLPDNIPNRAFPKTKEKIFRLNMKDNNILIEYEDSITNREIHHAIQCHLQKYYREYNGIYNYYILNIKEESNGGEVCGILYKRKDSLQQKVTELKEENERLKKENEQYQHDLHSTQTYLSDLMDQKKYEFLSQKGEKENKKLFPFPP